MRGKGYATKGGSNRACRIRGPFFQLEEVVALANSGPIVRDGVRLVNEREVDSITRLRLRMIKYGWTVGRYGFMLVGFCRSAIMYSN
jgi:hypothetical protein